MLYYHFGYVTLYYGTKNSTKNSTKNNTKNNTINTTNIIRHKI